ncbi:hypothetical protein [Alkalithermobacter paradoxus]|uniref:Uncharacterized protein n=1 Tax=Alkalithermobacter paradoxus TaxID=29349 RepID=A0A1V4I5S6_9FIRM|nr:hypothetical protein CLOTH_16250 [[Clostridium] thermoalcaliphilum]
MKKIILIILALGIIYTYSFITSTDLNYKKDQISTKTLEDMVDEKEIITNYKEKISNIQNKYTEKIEAIISGALQEYNQNQKNKTSIALKYYNKFKNIEKQSDEEVKKVLKDMEEELRFSNYSEYIIHLMKQYYEENKNAKKDYYIEKIRY